MVIFDANFLLLLLDPGIDVPADPATGQPLARAKDRVDYLVTTLSSERETIGIRKIDRKAWISDDAAEVLRTGSVVQEGRDRSQRCQECMVQTPNG